MKASLDRSFRKRQCSSSSLSLSLSLVKKKKRKKKPACVGCALARLLAERSRTVEVMHPY